MEQLSSHLAANLAELNARFGQSADFYAKELELYHCKGAIVLFDGMASLKGLWQLLLDAASRRTPPGPAEQLTGEQVFALLFEHSALPAEPDPVEDWEALIRRLTAGMAVLLLDGCAKGIAFSVQSLNAARWMNRQGREISRLPGRLCGSAPGEYQPAAAVLPQ